MSGGSAVARLARQGVFLGTCSWTDPTLIEAGTFYPHRQMTAAERLAHYAAQFPLVEVDATYYAPPAARTAGLWVERTPADFTFDVKAFRLLTQHPTPLRSLWKDIAAALPEELKARKNLYARDLPRELLAEGFDRFVSALLPLHSAGKLGVVLFQLPPYVAPSRGAYGYLAWAAERLSEYRVAVEFRQERWMDEAHRGSTLALLEEHGLTYVCVDAPQGFRSSVPPVAAATASLAEVRFHGRNTETWEAPGIGAAERFRYDYTSPELGEWVPRVRALAEQAGRVHVLMNNCYADYGVRSARLLADLLDQAW
ncbi:MAG: DUF72 domain-containing protein [Actinobacteria bacterium]|nr:DUF72 domain-containing protein [Actinomycetota bacterium]